MVLEVQIHPSLGNHQCKTRVKRILHLKHLNNIQRKDIMHQLINRLGIQLAKVNTDRKKNSMTEIQLEYA